MTKPQINVTKGLLQEFSVKSLKDILAKAGLSTSGTKAELIDRILKNR